MRGMFRNKKILCSIQIILVWILLLNSSCQSQLKSSTQENMKALKLLTSFPFPYKDSTVAYTKEEITLIEYGNLRVFQMPVTHHFSRTNVTKDGEYISDEYIKSEISYEYVVFRDGNKEGSKYDSLLDKTGTKISVDSFLSSSSMLRLGQLYSKKRINDSLITSIWSSDSTALTEYYVPKTKPDESYSDSTILKYDKTLQGYAFSLSTEMDSLVGLKLSQIKMVYNTNENATSAYGKNARSVTFEIAKTAIPYEPELVELINLFKRETQTK